MSNQTSDRFRLWVLGVAAMGLLWPAMPVLGQTKSSLFSIKKKVAATPVPVQTVEPPRLLAVPEDPVPAANAIQPVSQMEVAAAEKSEVQKQLEALYEQDGREMPNMTMNLQPISPTPGQLPPASQIPPATKPPARLTQGYTQYQPRTQSTSYPPQSGVQTPRNYSSALDAQQPSQASAQPKKNPVVSFFKRIGSNNKPTSQPPIPPDYANAPQAPGVPAVPGVPPATTQNVSALQTSPRMTPNYGATAAPAAQIPRSLSKPVQVSSTVPAPPRSPSLNVQVSVRTNPVPQELPQPSLSLPELSQQPIPLVVIVTKETSTRNDENLPQLSSEPQPPTAIAKSGAPTIEAATDFPNPFPDVPETVADRKVPASKAVAPVFPKAATVATNVVAPPKVLAPPQELQPVSPAKTDEDPFAVEAKDFSEPRIVQRPKPVVAPQVPEKTASTDFVAPRVINPTHPLEEPTKSDYSVFEKQLAEQFPNGQVRLTALARKIIVRGQASDANEANAILALIGVEVIKRKGKPSDPDGFLAGLSATQLGSLFIINELSIAAAPAATPNSVKPITTEEVAVNVKLTAPPALAIAPPDEVPELTAPPALATSPGFIAPPALTAPVTGEVKPAVEPTTPTSEPPALINDATGSPEKESETQLEKMRRIRERFGMKGLKGFCPVTLHDERELVDARPEFNATHRSQKFHFASAKAREKFESDPHRYAPAAYGADVVALSRDKDVVEGTLDFAAWYKGRLYLFATQGNYDAFVASPSKFASLAGAE